MPYLLTCGGCKKKLKVGDNLVGKSIKCPHCTRKMLFKPKGAPAPAAVGAGAKAKPGAAKPTAPVKTGAGVKAAAAPAGKVNLSPTAAKAAAKTPAKPAPSKPPAPAKPKMPPAPEPEAETELDFDFDEEPAAPPPKPAAKGKAVEPEPDLDLDLQEERAPKAPAKPATLTASKPAAPPKPIAPPKKKKDEEEEEDEGRGKKLKLLVGILIVLAVISAGSWWFFSGTNDGYVSGRVTLDEEPLANAKVSFVNEKDKGIFESYTDAAGNYSVKGNAGTGIPVGKYKVLVEKLGLKDGTVPGTPEELQAAQKKKTLVNLPGKDYLNPAATPLKLEVKVGNNSFNIALKKPADEKK